MQFKTTPRAKQFIALERSEGHDAFAYFMEMRTGKTKVTLDDAARAWRAGRIDCLLVLAPNGVHRQWVEDACPEHMAVPYIAVYYSASGKVAHKRQFDKVVEQKINLLKVITLNIESAGNKKGQEIIATILRSHSCMFVIDESDTIKTPSAKCTKFLLKVSKFAKMRRILTGTPITQTPLGLFTQMKFLNPHILHQTTHTSFKARYAIVKRMLKREGMGKLESYCEKNNIIYDGIEEIPYDILAKAGVVLGRDGFDSVTGYKNIDELERLVAPHCYRLKASECDDLPTLVNMKLYTELTAEQSRIYNDMMEDAVAHLTPVPDNPKDLVQWYLDNDRIEASNALTKFLRAQQILGGHVPDANGKLRYIKHNRIKTLMDFLPQVQGKVIIWASFRAEIAEICEAIRAAYPAEDRMYDPVAEFHGGISPDDRIINKKCFQQAGSGVNFLVGQPRAGGVGHTFDAADTVIFYSNAYSARTRWQAEVRASAVGKESIAVVDIVAPKTIDEKILQSLDTCRKTAEEFNYANET